MDESRRLMLRSIAGVGGLGAGAALLGAPASAAAAAESGQTGWINVRTDFGAKGDGVTDDTSAIQQALAAVPVGGVVYFPNGVYQVSSPLTVTVAGTKLLGDKASTGYSAGGANQTVVNAASGFAGAAVIVAASIPDFAMRDLTVHAPNTTGTTIGLQITGSGSCMLENVLVARTAGDGIYLGGANPVVLRQVGVYHAGTGGAGHGFNIQGISDSWYTDCLAAGCATSGWNIQGGDNSTWIGCRAEDGLKYGFWFHDTASLYGGISFVGCSTDLNDADGFRLQTLSGNGAIQLNGCQFRRDGNNAGAGTTSVAGITVTGCKIPVLLDGTTVTARQGDAGGADAPYFGLSVAASAYVSVNGGYLSCASAGSPISWDATGALPIGPNVLTATVSASVPTYAYSMTWNTDAGAQFVQCAATDTSVLVQTLTGATTGTNPLIHQHHPVATTKALGVDVTGDSSMRWTVQADGTQAWGPGSAARDTTLTRLGAAQLGTPDSDLVIGLAGRGLKVKEGANAKMGTLVLDGSTPVTVNTTAVTAESRIFLTIQAPGGTPGGIAYVKARVAAASFSVVGAPGDTSTVAWLIVEPA
jgi:hypothetical protein